MYPISQTAPLKPWATIDFLLPCSGTTHHVSSHPKPNRHFLLLGQLLKKASLTVSALFSRRECKKVRVQETDKNMLSALINPQGWKADLLNMCKDLQSLVRNFQRGKIHTWFLQSICYCQDLVYQLYYPPSLQTLQALLKICLNVIALDNKTSHQMTFNQN